MFYLIGVVVTFFLAFVLLTKREKNYADIVLFFWLIVIGIHLFLFYLGISNKFDKFPYLLGINIPIPLLHGPLLFIYTSSLTNNRNSWKLNLLHFIPFILFFILTIDFLLLAPAQKLFIYKNDGIGYETLLFFNQILIMLSGIVYFSWSLLLLKKHRKTINEYFSYSEKIRLIWLRYLIYGIGIIWLFVIFSDDEHVFFSVVLFVLFIGFFGINQVGIFTQSSFAHDKEFTKKVGEKILNIDTNVLDEEISGGISQKKEKYVKSGLNQEKASKIYKELNHIIENDKLYTNPELSLIDLAKKLEVHPNNLSQVINTFEEKNFYDYINNKRVEHFIELIENVESKKFTLLSIAFDSGFNSKSSFNKHFKKVTNKTPTEYINSISS